MAEAIGFLASGIALSQLADQIVRSIRSLHKLWRDIRGGPASLATTLEELEILGDTLLQLQGDTGRQNECRPGAKSLGYCQKTAEELEEITKKLQRGLEGGGGERDATMGQIKSGVGEKRNLGTAAKA
jgi:hypothetical protein